MFEVLLPHGAHKFGMLKEIDIDRDGLMHAPTGPGLGAEIDFELIARNTEAVLR
jgi:L-alanine-DL-glutamate epimerase-like enolase superfamily enzyme